ncbi:ankyrin repeat domain-containing protein 49 [Hydra vulgaris]|uniref:ankyrin repeat domain-containing protein 49 n=1 Tax=Hydra vulgaris TaxID=6087 RepID=UPI001F5E99A4|nr:ankyrin repeat domain-containing protein 49 [Hydra vulgaris]
MQVLFPSKYLNARFLNKDDEINKNEIISFSLCSGARKKKMLYGSNKELKIPINFQIYRSSSTSALSAPCLDEEDTKLKIDSENDVVEKTQSMMQFSESDILTNKIYEDGINTPDNGRKRLRAFTETTLDPEMLTSRKSLKLKTPMAARFSFLNPHSIPFQNEKVQKTSTKISKHFKPIKTEYFGSNSSFSEEGLQNLLYVPFTKKVSESEKRFYQILQAIKSDECKLVKTIVKKKIIATSEIRKKDSLIHEAAYKGCLKCTKILIKNGSSLHSIDDEGFSPVHAAVIGGNFEVLRYLLENGASPNSVSNTGWSPMHLVIATSKDNLMLSLKMLDVLTKHGGNPFIKTNLNVTPFQLCINLKIILLLDYYICSSKDFLVKHY